MFKYYTTKGDVKMSDPKKQHFVPQTYLSFFKDNSGYVHIYDKVKDEFRKQTPANTGYSKHFYTVETNGEKDFFIEKALAVKVDVLYNPLIEKINKEEIFNNEDKRNLGLFLACQYLRTPAQRKNHNSMIETTFKKITKITYGLKKHHGVLTDSMNNPEMESFVENEEYTVDVPKEHSLELLMNFADEMGNMLSKQNIIIIKASHKSEFISSDNPYSMVKEEWVQKWEGFGVINTVKIFPLTPKHVLVLKDVGEKMIYIQHFSRDKVRELNFQIANWSDRFLFSNNELLLKGFVQKIKKRSIKK